MGHFVLQITTRKLMPLFSTWIFFICSFRSRPINKTACLPSLSPFSTLLQLNLSLKITVCTINCIDIQYTPLSNETRRYRKMRSVYPKCHWSEGHKNVFIQKVSEGFYTTVIINRDISVPCFRYWSFICAKVCSLVKTFCAVLAFKIAW